MKKILSFIILICILATFLCGCSISPITKDVVQFPSGDRLDDIANSNDETINVVTNATIDEWITEYNKKTDYRTIDIYYITQSDNCYYVYTDTDVYTVTLDASGEVALFTLTTGSLQDKLSVANVTMDIFKNREYIPEDVKNQMQLIDDEFKALNEQISEYISSYSSETLDTSLDYSNDVEEAARLLLEKIEEYRMNIS